MGLPKLPVIIDMTEGQIVRKKHLIGVREKKVIRLGLQKSLKGADIIDGRQYVSPQFGGIIDLGTAADAHYDAQQGRQPTIYRTPVQ